MTESTEAAHHQSTWATLKEAVRGTHEDFTVAPIGRSVILLAVPMVLEMLMESVFAVADIFFVGRLGASAVATVGLTESLMVIVYALAIGLSIGAAATVARRIGEKDPERAALTAVQAIILGSNLVRAARVFDVYSGDPIPKGKKSLAFAITYQAEGKTLTDEDVAKERRRITERLRNELDAELRG